MRTFLLFLSSLLAIWPLRATGEGADSTATQIRLPRQACRIETSAACLSGLLLASEDAETIYGSLVNEFGVTAIGFTYSKERQKVRLIHVVGFLDKWYIRPVLRSDLSYCLHALYHTPRRQKSHRYEVVRSADSIAVTNRRHRITYTFSPLVNPPLDYDTQE